MVIIEADINVKMNSKERAALKAAANTLEPLFQVGKGGVNDALITQVCDVFKSRELIKLKVLLETSPEKPKEIANEIAEKTGSEVVQVIGGAMIFYKYNASLHEDKSKKYEKAIIEKVASKKKSPVSVKKVKKGTAVKPNSKKRFSFTIKDSKEIKQHKKH